MSDETMTAEEIAKAEQRKAAETKATEINKTRTGKGTRMSVGSTRGRSTQVISYEAFDLSQPNTLPMTLSEFMEITKISDEPTIVSYLLDGFNSSSYTQASDPIAEFVEPTWPEDVQKGFRLVVRNYATNAGVSIEDAVALIKPGIVSSQAKK